MLLRVLSVIGLAFGGGLIALVGAAAHTSANGWGLPICLLLVLSAAMFAKVAQGWTGFGVAAAAWVLVTTVVSQKSPAGSVLIAEDFAGMMWVFGGAALWFIVAAVPRFVLVGRDVTS